MTVNSVKINLPEGTGELTVSQENGQLSCHYTGALPRDLAAELTARFASYTGGALRDDGAGTDSERAG